jgi:hypothetical protein
MAMGMQSTGSVSGRQQDSDKGRTLKFPRRNACLVALLSREEIITCLEIFFQLLLTLYLIICSLLYSSFQTNHQKTLFAVIFIGFHNLVFTSHNT